MLSRRTLLAASLLVPSLDRAASAATASDRDDALRRDLAGLEARHGGRLGVAIRDIARANGVAHRGDERFPMCSTWKVLVAAFVLSQVDRGVESLERRIVYREGDLVPYSPVTRAHAGKDGLRLAQLCEAAVTVSDNTAANVLLDSFGGPTALTRYLRTLGDSVTRLDRREPELNEAAPGDPRDTSSPFAILDSWFKIVLGTALSASSRAQLIAWLRATTTGTSRLRAGVPGGWQVGDKTGSGGHDATNDVAVIWPPGRAPILVAAFYVDGPPPEEARSAVLADVGRLAAAV